MDIQEIISRGRFIFSDAPKRLDVFKLVNGRMSAKDIARKTNKSLTSTLNDFRKIKDVGLINIKKDSEGRKVQKEGSIVYEKVSLVKQIPISYFQNPIKSQKTVQIVTKRNKKRTQKVTYISFPSEKNIIDICSSGENQIHEFKAAGTEFKKIVKEIAAMLHNKNGGIILYGVEDSGKIVGTDLRAQELDQPLQNTIRDSIDPSPPNVKIKQQKVLGQEIILLSVPAWNRKEVYQYNHKVYVRKGTNAFPAKSADTRKLHKGQYLE
ncbi:ATP-binding protein [Candidatus Woesearchaeota archaeon]|nr:ATP-binding protein [Candidatus Woesearchaeota archaeon]